MYLNRDMDGRPFLVYFLPIFGGKKVAVLDSIEGWCAAGNLIASRVLIHMDDRMDGQKDDGMDDRTDLGEISFLIPTSFTLYDTQNTCGAVLKDDFSYNKRCF